MAVKRTGQVSFVDAMLSNKGGGSLARLDGLVKWYRFEKLIRHLRSEGTPGRPGYPVLVLFKALLVQSLYGLSDRELEEALDDRLSFRRFAGLSLEEPVPDHSVLNRFRNQLVAESLLDKLFGELDRQLEQAGLVLKRGTMLDATLIETVSRRPDGDAAAADPEAKFTSRQGKSGSVYGYKMHVGVDQGSGLIRSVLATPANINDTVVADALVRGDERAVLADGAYHTHGRQARLEALGIKARLIRRANKHHRLKPRIIAYNRLIARQRWAVETTFATLKRRMGLTAIRYRGLTKASGQLLLAAIAFNLRRWAVITP